MPSNFCAYSLMYSIEIWFFEYHLAFATFVEIGKTLHYYFISCKLLDLPCARNKFRTIPVPYPFCQHDKNNMIKTYRYYENILSKPDDDRGHIFASSCIATFLTSL